MQADERIKAFRQRLAAIRSSPGGAELCLAALDEIMEGDARRVRGLTRAVMDQVDCAPAMRDIAAEIERLAGW